MRCLSFLFSAAIVGCVSLPVGVSAESSDGFPAAAAAGGAGSGSARIADILIDNRDHGFTATGSWNAETTATLTAVFRQDALTAPTGAARAHATWSPEFEHAGLYRVYAWWGGATNQTNRAPFTITHAKGSDSIAADQTAGAGTWNLLGTWEFLAGRHGKVTLSNDSAPGTTVAADAIRFEFVGHTTPAPSGAVHEDFHWLYYM